MIWIWLSARFQFIWLNSLIKNEVLVKIPFQQFKKQGDSIFKLMTVSGLLTLAVFFLMGWYCLSAIMRLNALDQIDWSVVMSSGLLVLMVPFFLFVCAVYIWFLMVSRFVMPIMMSEGITYLPAWDKLCRIYRIHRGDFVCFVLIIFAMTLICSILESVISIAAIIVMVILGGITYGLGYLAFYALLKSKVLFIGFAVGAGIPMVFAFVAVLFAVMLPFAVFSWNFSLYFLSSLNEGYAPLSLDEAAAAKG